MYGVTTQKACPIRKHELLAAFGFEENQVAQLLEEDAEWTETLLQPNDSIDI